MPADTAPGEACRPNAERRAGCEDALYGGFRSAPAVSQPIVIDAMMYFWGQSIPGAVGLKYAGLGGSFADAAQARLGKKLSS